MRTKQYEEIAIAGRMAGRMSGEHIAYMGENVALWGGAVRCDGARNEPPAIL